MKRSFIFAGVVCAAGLTFAQAEPGAATPTASASSASSTAATPVQPAAKVSIADNDLPGTTAGTITEGLYPDAATACTNFLQKKKWREGVCLKNDGSPFIVVVGTASISGNLDDDYTQNRVLAFGEAMAVAKGQVAKFLNTTIETSSVRRISKPDRNSPPEEVLAWEIANAPKDSPLARLYQDFQEDLAAELAKQDVDMAAARAAGGEAAAKAEKKAIQITQSKVFQERAEAAANAVVSGLQAYTSFEVLNENGQGSVGVVAIWSPKLSYYASAFVNRNLPIKLGKAKSPIEDRIEKDPQKLLSMYGVTAMVNERGEQVLVSYNQAVPLDDTDMDDVNSAYEEAQFYAEAQIRDFAGEAIKASEKGSRGVARIATKGLGKYTRTENNYERTIETRAEAMTVRGMARLRPWKTVHPYTGRVVCGAIVTWSPSAAKFADQAKSYLDDVAAPAAEGQSDYNEPLAPNANAFGEDLNPNARQNEAGKNASEGLKPTAGQEHVNQFYGGGAEGDDDAF